MLALDTLRPSWNALDETDRKYLVYLARRLAMDHDEVPRREWMTRAEAAAYAGCSRDTISRAAATGRLASTVPAGKVHRRFSRHDVDRWMHGMDPAPRAKGSEGEETGP